MKSWLSLTLVLLAAISLHAETEKPAKPAKDKKTPVTTTSEEKEDAMLKSLPAGETYYGLRIPNFGPGGKLLMMFDTKSAKRIDDRNLEMQDLKIEIHNKDGTTFHVKMAHSIFNLDTRFLTSDTPTEIRRDDFVITGAKAEFQLKTKFGRMIGPTKMIINSDNVK